MKPIFTLLIIAAILSSGSLRAEVPAPEAPAAETDEAAKQEEAAIAGLPNVELTPRLLYQFLLAEINECSEPFRTPREGGEGGMGVFHDRRHSLRIMKVSYR